LSRALALLKEESWRRAKLAENIERFRQRAESLPLSKSKTPIQPVIIGDNARALKISESLAEKGFWVRAIRPPTVPEGTARLRVTLSAAHQPEQIDRLVDALLDCLA
jgi:8-amino-7-oxononanoate synthase